MKILFASSSSGSRGGGELFLLLLGRELARRGHDVHLWASRHRRMDELAAAFSVFGGVRRSDYRNMYDHPARCFSVWFHGADIRRIAGEWRDFSPDVLHLNKQNLEDAFDLQRAAALSGLRAVSTVHITQSARYLGAKCAGLRDGLSRRELAKFPGPFVVIQPNRKRELGEFLQGRGRVVAIENGVPDLHRSGGDDAGRALRAGFGMREDGTLFVCVARMEEQKRPLLFVEWAVKIRKRHPGAHFLWVGDGRLAEAWDRVVEEAGAGAYVRRVGWQKDVTPFLLAADACLHTARYESFLPLSVLEAMSAGRAVIMPPDLTDDIPFLREEEAFVLPLEEAGIPALTDRTVLDRSAAVGRRIFEEHFSLGRMADRYEALYQSAT